MQYLSFVWNSLIGVVKTFTIMDFIDIVLVS